MSLSSAFAPAEFEYKARVMACTWGHLAPKKNKKYRGQVFFSCADYGGDIVILKSSMDAPDSPWFFDAMQAFVCDQLDRPELERGEVYCFEGTFCNYRFVGGITRVLLTERVAI